MALPEPEVGLVIHYSYLWRGEALSGQEEGTKERPCVVVVAVRRSVDRTLVMVAPITHSPPRSQGNAVEVGAATKQRLGLDAERSWIVTDDLNSFDWPGYDVRPAPGRSSTFEYGYLDQKTIRAVTDAVRALAKRGHLRRVDRS